jgi:single-strand DNA-binding protein
MRTNNKVQLSGRLTNDPEMITFYNGDKLTRFRMVTNKFLYEKDGKKHFDTQWHNVVVKGKYARKVAEDFSRDSEIRLVGKLGSRSYFHKTGIKRHITEVSVRYLLS